MVHDGLEQHRHCDPSANLLMVEYYEAFDQFLVDFLASFEHAEEDHQLVLVDSLGG